MDTDEDLLRQAFQALLRGDTKERDRLCAQVEARVKAREAEDVKLAQAASPYFAKH